MKKTVKGFTLVELIIVMAIFGVIMFGALSLMQPVSNIMRTTEVNENGNAVTSNISEYIRSQISPCDNLMVYNFVPLKGDGTPDETVIETEVANFINAYYKGFVKPGCDPASPLYGSGVFHVMLLDNTHNGRISTLTYKGDFGSAGGVGAANISRTAYTPSAINKAYYDSYQYTFKLGNLTTVDEFTTATDTFASTTTSMSASNTAISILAKTTQSGTDYSFINHCSFSMVNIANKGQNYPPSMYYVAGNVPELDADGNPVAGSTVPGIIDVHDSSSGYTPTVPINYNVEPDPALQNGYMFIYSYASEIN